MQILLIDDEEGILNSLERLLRNERHGVLKARTAAEARELLRTHEDIALLICDLRLPDETGDQVLLYASEIRPEAHRIALSGQADRDLIINSINLGQVDRFFVKPWNNEVLLTAVRKLLWQYNVERENERLEAQLYEKNELLEGLNANLEEKVAGRTHDLQHAATKIQQSISSVLELVTRMMELQIPGLRGHCRRVADLSSLLAKAAGCNPDEIAMIEMAALVHDIGKCSLPATMHRKRILDMTTEEKLAYCQHPVIGAEFLSDVPWFEKIVQLVRHHHESVSGRGFPDHLAGDAIPLGARILAVADSYDRHRFPLGENVMGSRAQAEQFMRMSSGGRLDARLVELFLSGEIPTHNEQGDISVDIPIGKLCPGMVLARDVINSLKQPLLRSPCTFTDEIIANLKRNPGFDPIMSRILIVRNSIPETGVSEEEMRAQATVQDSGVPVPVPDEGERKTVMAVDDEPSILSALKRELYQGGYNLQTYVNPIDALRDLRTGRPIHAIITDYSMPTVRGDRFLMQVQREFPQIPCIVITARATRDTILTLGKAAKIVRIFPKPWNKEELLATLRQLETVVPEA